jgi:hypothetical protein
LISKFIFYILCFLVAGCNSSYDISSNSNTKTFNSTDWKAAKEVDRHVYVNDLLSKNILIGKTKSETIDLLGMPNPYSQAPDKIDYIIKVGGSGFDSVHFLEINFSEKGVVSSALVRSD